MDVFQIELPKIMAFAEGQDETLFFKRFSLSGREPFAK